MAVSPHLTNIPEAVRIASGAANADPELKQQAIDYLARVKELSGETWQVRCLFRLSPALAGLASSVAEEVWKQEEERI